MSLGTSVNFTGAFASNHINHFIRFCNLMIEKDAKLRDKIRMENIGGVF